MEESITPAWRFKTNREGAKREKNIFLQVFSYNVEIDIGMLSRHGTADKFQEEGVVGAQQYD